MNSLLRKSGPVLGVAALGLWAALALTGPNGLANLKQKSEEISELQSRNARLKADNDRKRQRIEELKHEGPALDEEIRRRTGLVRPGETQFIVPQPAESGETIPPGAAETPATEPATR